MRRKDYAPVAATKFEKTDTITVNNRVIVRGDFIKIIGEHGGRFKFHSLVTNKKTGAQWIDCFEIHKTVVSACRSFRSDRIKLIPIKRGRRNVNRSTAS